MNRIKSYLRILFFIKQAPPREGLVDLGFMFHPCFLLSFVRSDRHIDQFRRNISLSNRSICIDQIDLSI
uniref:Uncharacterized protein n=1 Tax=Cycas taitungensis TaxID=54799 RepID=A6H5M7_CYCTA|nr:hypothetical protein CYtaCp087 [Cycas taitungensis]YP_001312286.1 hypothetical protein CYtaCp122 [Cycas taitungensis]BAF64993.1 hypothetical protein [Cycas taitungensis]BAF65028.1 hypothetical protein [Cycas taitungensis]